LIAFVFLMDNKNFTAGGIKEKMEIGKLGNWVKLRIINYKLLIPILAIIAIPLYFTRSYGAFLGILGGIIYLSLFVKNNRLKIEKHKSKISLALIFVLFLATASLFSGKLEQIYDSDGRSSFHSRLVIWNASAEIIKDHPLFGIGPGTFQQTYLSYAGRFSKPYLEWAVPQPHNVFLAFYLQTGLIGFIGFVLIISWFFKSACRKREAAPCVYAVVSAIMIYILVHGLVDTTYWKNDLALMFWLVISIVLSGKFIVERISSD